MSGNPTSDSSRMNGDPTSDFSIINNVVNSLPPEVRLCTLTQNSINTIVVWGGEGHFFCPLGSI